MMSSRVIASMSDLCEPLRQRMIFTHGKCVGSISGEQCFTSVSAISSCASDIAEHGVDALLGKKRLGEHRCYKRCHRGSPVVEHGNGERAVMAVTVATDAHAVVVEEVGKGLCRYGMCAFGECRKHYLAYELVASLRLTSAEKYPKAAYRLVSATETVECQPVGQHLPSPAWRLSRVRFTGGGVLRSVISRGFPNRHWRLQGRTECLCRSWLHR